jgi:AraC family transcriptional regulator, positive regulator of tynA and feaB
MPISASTDLVPPADRQAFWTEAICRSFANVETRPLGAATVSGHFEFVEMGDAKLVRFDSSPQCYSRDSRLVSRAGSDDFMFDFQTRGRSWMTQGAREGAIELGYGVLYDARRPFEDRLDGPGARAEVLIATVPAAALLGLAPEAERLCATPIPLAGTIARTITALVRAAIVAPGAQAHVPQKWIPVLRERTCANKERDEIDIVAYLAALLRLARDGTHDLCRADLFPLIDIHLRRTMAAPSSPVALAAQFGISQRTFHRVFADRGTTFERHVLRRRVERFRALLSQPRLSGVPIARLALECGFADAAHASRTFKGAFAETPRDYRAGALGGAGAA